MDILILRGLAEYSNTQKEMYTAVNFYCTEQKFAESLIIDIFDSTDLHCERAPIAINILLHLLAVDNWVTPNTYIL